MSRKFANYVPHNKFIHIDTKGDNYENYLRNLSNTVSVACDKFFERRGIVSVNPFTPKGTEAEKNARAAEAMKMAWKIAKDEIKN